MVKTFLGDFGGFLNHDHYSEADNTMRELGYHAVTTMNLSYRDIGIKS